MKDQQADLRHIITRAAELRGDLNSDINEGITRSIYTAAGRITDRVRKVTEPKKLFRFDKRVDAVVTSRIFGFPLMILLFAAVFWITISGANIPSSMLASLLLDRVHPFLLHVAAVFGMPWWLSGLLIDGIYLATAWVVSVMLPPMAIFFPLFTLLEDLGYLPRVAFNLDKSFKQVGAHGKQSLTMMMGFGCNAAGIIATRIIDSPRERLIAIITNNFALCNGRWPTQILIAMLFVGSIVPSYMAGFISAAVVVGIALLGILLSFAVSWGLSKTVLQGEKSSFSLELPPYRPPQILKTIYTSIIDRTLFVLWRAAVFAVPAGAVIWLVGNLSIKDTSLAEYMIGFLSPRGYLMGLNGIILLAFIIAVPANEIVIPNILMLIVMTSEISGVGGGAGGYLQTRLPGRDYEGFSSRRLDTAYCRESDAVFPDS
jgi:ferrous iron transport protein B